MLKLLMLPALLLALLAVGAELFTFGNPEGQLRELLPAELIPAECAFMEFSKPPALASP